MDGFSEVGPVDVGDEPEVQGAFAVVFKRLVSHHWPEVGTSDTDVDHVANAFAGMALPGAASNPVRKFSHLVEHRMHLRDDVLTIDNNRGPLRCPERYVQDSTIFRDIDLLASKHGVDSLPETALFSQLEQEFERFVGDAILGVIEKEADCLG